MKQTLLLLCALFANQAFACSCIRPDMARMEKNAEFVVLAQLKGSLWVLGNKRYVFATTQSYKGDANERIVAWTSLFEVSCGLPARRDVPYVLFVYRVDDKLRVDHCSSWPLIENHVPFTAAFNEYYGLTGAEALQPSSRKGHDSDDVKPGG